MAGDDQFFAGDWSEDLRRNTFAHTHTQLNSNPQPFNQNEGPYQGPYGPNPELHRSQFQFATPSNSNLGSPRSSFHTAPPQPLPPSQVHGLRGFHTGPQPRNIHPTDTITFSGVTFDPNGVIDLDNIIPPGPTDHNHMDIDHIDVSSSCDDVAISLIRNFVELYRTTFFYPEKVDALAILTGLSCQKIWKVFSQVLEDGLPGLTRNTISSKHSKISNSTSQSLQSTSHSSSSATTVSQPIGPSKIQQGPAVFTNSSDRSPLGGRPVLKQAAESLSHGRADKCQPTLDQTLLSRDENRIYQCTFKCGARFRRKADLRRHEEEGNYPQEGWICDVDPVVMVDDISTCAYCRLQNPSMAHAQAMHKNRAPFCHEKEIDAWGKIFTRKKRFIEHYKAFHPALPVAAYLNSCHFVIQSEFPRWCGFCERSQDFDGSKARNNHMASHFEDGLDMSGWKDPPTSSETNDEDDDIDGDGDESNDDANDDMDEEEDHDLTGHESQPKDGSSGGSQPQYNNRCGDGSFSMLALSGSAKDNFSGVVMNLRNHKGTSFIGDVRTYDTSPFSKARMTAPFRSDPAKVQRPSYRTAVDEMPTPTKDFEFTLSRYQRYTVALTLASSYFSTHFDPWIYSQWIGNDISILRDHSQSNLSSDISILRDHIQSYLSRKLYTPSDTQIQPADCITALDPAFRQFSWKDEKLEGMQSRSTRIEHSSLGEDLWGALVPCKPHSFFLPVNELKRLLTTDSVLYELQLYYPEALTKINSDMADFIVTQAQRLFALLIYIGKGSTIKDFLKKGITDNSLPIHNVNDKTFPAFAQWTPRAIETFRREQWCFIPPSFDIGQHYEFDDNTILPFIEDNESRNPVMFRVGGYSEVYAVRIHSSHHRFWHSESLELAPQIAVKRLYSADEADFEKEVSMLKALAKKEHPHIIKLLATYRMGGRYHLMFPWADKSLRTYWHDHPHPKWNQETLMWDLGQMKGIASGLQAIHNFRQQDCRTRQAHPTLLVPGQVEPDEYWYGRHGDIKPENILWFRSTELKDADKAGVLQIADFGLGRFHGRESRSQMPARTIVSTPTYEPPELALDLKVSRAYDIWSLGCVFLEYITWRVGGFDMLEAFDYARLVEENDGYCSNKFYTLRRDIDHETHAFVQDAVAQWIMRLHSHERCSGLIHALLDLVKNQLLVVSAKRRITSATLVAELQKLAERAETDYGYLIRPAPYGDIVSKTTKDTGSKVGYSPPLLVDNTELKKPISQAMRSTLQCQWPPGKHFDCDSSFGRFYKSRNAIESLLFSSA